MTSLGPILDKLEGFYGEVSASTPDDPYELVIFLNSGYPASDERCHKGFAALKRDIGSAPEAILSASDASLAKAMTAGGMVPELRAKRLRQIAEIIRDELGGDLRTRLIAAPAQAKALLKRFPTFGNAAAERILLFCGLAPEPAVPAVGLQVMVRLALCEQAASFDKTYRAAYGALGSALPEDIAARRRAYLLLKTHGHQLCKNAKPLCEQCPLSSDCVYYRLVSSGQDSLITARRSQ